MNDRVSRSGNGRRATFPASTPPEINHAVVTGWLSAEPQEARSPMGERVTLMRVEFPVADPDDPRTLWTWASCLVEVPGDRARREISELHGGAPILAAGQLSNRWMIEGGHTSRRGRDRRGPGEDRASARTARPVGHQGRRVNRRAPTSAPPTPEMKVRFGENLARCREGADVSQEELGFRASTRPCGSPAAWAYRSTISSPEWSGGRATRSSCRGRGRCSGGKVPRPRAPRKTRPERTALAETPSSAE